MDEESRRAVALFRYAVLGPLVSARLEHGDRVALFVAASRRDHVTANGRVVRISARTIEAWYYAYRAACPADAERSRRLRHQPFDDRDGARHGATRQA